MGGKGSVRQGRQGEEYAACFLKEHGYRILASNFCTKQGEIDLIAENGEYLAFIEVKTRKIGALSPGYQAVSKGKQGRIYAAAMEFIYRFPLDLQPRFDVLCLETSCESEFRVVSTEYYENAFTTEGLKCL
jgi:putative endonuclease